MRFDHQPARCDDDSLADDVPEELALLGRALSDDAARLAERYPLDHRFSALGLAGESSAAGLVPSSPAARRRWRGPAVATVAAASIILAIFVGRGVLRPEAPLADQGPARGLVHDGSGAPRGMPAAPVVVGGEPLPVRGAFFLQLSNPQQEAVLDLQEDNVLAQSRVSI